MKLRGVGHSFRNSASPDLMPNSSQSVLKRRIGFGFIPGTVWKLLEIAVFDEPAPDQRIDRITHCGDLLRSAPLPGLGLFNPQKLLPIPKSIFNRPSKIPIYCQKVKMVLLSG